MTIRIFSVDRHPGWSIAPAPTSSPAQNPLCRTCGQGSLIGRKTFRMSATVVVIGFILLIPSVFGMLVGVSMLFITGAAGTQTSNVGERNIRVRLVGQHVPEPIIAKVMASKPVRNSELASLSLEQQSAIHDAQSSVSAHKAGAGAATIIAGGLSLLIIFTSFVGGLVGWLLIMRKRVLQCVRCGAVVPGS